VSGKGTGEKGREKGREQGREKGREQGREKGREQGGGKETEARRGEGGRFTKRWEIDKNYIPSS